MSKEQTLTAREKFDKEVDDLYWLELQNTNGRETDLEMFRKGIEVGLERGNEKVLEALEREFREIDISLFNEYRSLDYYETEVKPKYK